MTKAPESRQERCRTKQVLLASVISITFLIGVAVGIFCANKSTTGNNKKNDLLPPTDDRSIDALPNCLTTRNTDETFRIEITPAITNIEWVIERQVNDSNQWHWRGRTKDVVWVDPRTRDDITPLIPVVYRVRKRETRSGPYVICKQVHAYQLPPIRSIDWSATGRVPAKHSTTLVEIQPDITISDDSERLQAAIDSAHNNGGGFVMLRAGNYLVSKTLVLRENVVLRGDGASNTEIFFDGPIFQGILVGSTIPREQGWQTLSINVDKGSTVIEVTNPQDFVIGGYAEIEMENYPEDPPANNGWSQPPGPGETWRLRVAGQMLRVTNVSDTSITVTPSVHLTYETIQNARIRSVNLIQGAGIELIRLQMSDENRGRAVKIQYAAYFSMYNVETNNARSAHIELFSAYECHLQGIFMAGVSANGNGGQGYGINIGRHTTGCLIENNILRGFRHAVVFHVGATGNVLGYNYITESVHPELNRADVSFHGHFANSNLVEGNVVQQIYVADWWGRVGPWNTFLRNCIRPVRPGDSGDLRISYDSDHQNLLGNVFIKNTSHIVIDDGVDHTIVIGNVLRGTEWESLDGTSLPNSLYLLERPHYFRQELTWPVAVPNTGECGNDASKREFGVMEP